MGRPNAVRGPERQAHDAAERHRAGSGLGLPQVRPGACVGRSHRHALHAGGPTSRFVHWHGRRAHLVLSSISCSRACLWYERTPIHFSVTALQGV
eukprot:6181882-Pleurochrysis_carterae.AAC.1